MDIVASSGARYFVPTTMHHDGFAIFDTGDATHRSSVYLGPERDFLAEMFDSAKSRHPDLVLGTYVPSLEHPCALLKPFDRIATFLCPSESHEYLV